MSSSILSHTRPNMACSETKRTSNSLTKFGQYQPVQPARLNDVSARFVQKILNKHKTGTDMTGKSVFSHHRRDSKGPEKDLGGNILNDQQMMVSYFGSKLQWPETENPTLGHTNKFPTHVGDAVPEKGYKTIDPKIRFISAIDNKPIQPSYLPLESYENFKTSFDTAPANKRM